MFLTFEEYKELGGQLELAPFSFLENLASKKIIEITRNRINDVVVTKTDEITGLSPLKNCVFSLVLFYEKNNVLSAESKVISKSNNGISISYQTETTDSFFSKEFFIINTWLYAVKAADGNSVMWRGVR